MVVTTHPFQQPGDQPSFIVKTDFARGNTKYRIGRQIRQASAVDFFNLLTGPELMEMTEAHLPEHRERLYPPTVTLSMFMKQSRALDRSCQRAVDAWAGHRPGSRLDLRW